MKTAEDFRAIARDALRGRWLSCAGVGLLAVLMGAAIFGSGGSSSGIRLDSDDFHTLRTLWGSGFFFRYRIFFFLGGGMLLIYALVRLLIGGAATLGYAQYNLDLVDGKETDVSTLFSQFYRFWPAFCLQFLRGLYVFLWSLLLVIPGIIASYRYSMAAYIMAEHPDMTPSEAIDRSREMMVGNKFRLFCLSFSFIGWSLLCAVPIFLAIFIAAAIRSVGGAFVLLSLGAILSSVCILFLRPYCEAAQAAFYREISAPVYEEIPSDPTLYSYEML